MLKLKCPPADLIIGCRIQSRCKCSLALSFIIELKGDTREVKPPGSPDRGVLNLVNCLTISLLSLIPL